MAGRDGTSFSVVGDPVRRLLLLSAQPTPSTVQTLLHACFSADIVNCLPLFVG